MFDVLRPRRYIAVHCLIDDKRCRGGHVITTDAIASAIMSGLTQPSAAS